MFARKVNIVLIRLTSLILVAILFGEQGNSFRNRYNKSLERPIVHAMDAANLVSRNSLPLAVPKEMGTWYGIRNVSMDDMQIVADNLGGTVITIDVGMQGADQINTRLDMIQSLGYRAVVVFYTREICSKRPWEWNGSEWVFPQTTIETLQGIAHHPAIFAIYALHEPFDTGNECYWTVGQQRELYQLLKNYTEGEAIWSDVGGLAIQESRDIELTDGICDYCGTFHHRFRGDWTSEQCLEEILDWIDADLDTQQRLMPNSQIVFQIQTCSLAEYRFPLRLPTVEELTIVRDHLCALNQPMLYYVWSHSAYDSTLRDAPQLWPVVAQGCTYVTHLPLVLNHTEMATEQE